MKVVSTASKHTKRDRTMSNIKPRIAIALAVGVWFALALLTDNRLSVMPLRVYSIAGALATLMFLAWDQYIWRWSLVRRFTGTPLIRGTWRGTIESSYSTESNCQPAKIPAILYISQTASRVTATLFTDESQSASENAIIVRESDGRWRLTWSYKNTTRPMIRESDKYHCGAAEIYIGYVLGEGLKGSYFTDRKTSGELHFKEWSPRRYSSLSSAVNAGDFTEYEPFTKPA